MDLKKLVAMSNRYGSNPDYVLAGGGNTSVKDDTTLYVKCSGTRLADITEDGFVALDLKGLRELMNKEYPAEDAAREAAFLADVMDTRTDADLNKRPSVEALLHSLFPQAYVLHVHPSMINGLTCSNGGEKLAAELLGDDVLWIPLCRPGYTLGKLCYGMMQDYEKEKGKKVQILLLQNHGIFVAGDSVEEIDALFSKVENALKKVVIRTADLTAPDDSVCALLDQKAGELTDELGVTVIPVKAKEAVSFAESAETAKPLLKPFTPDHIVYCGPWPLTLTKTGGAKEALAAFEQEKGVVPKLILLYGVGAFIMEDDEASRSKAELLFRDAMKIAVFAESFGGPLSMTEDLTDFILHWEAESYRKKQ